MNTYLDLSWDIMSLHPAGLEDLLYFNVIISIVHSHKHTHLTHLPLSVSVNSHQAMGSWH